MKFLKWLVAKTLRLIEPYLPKGTFGLTTFGLSAGTLATIGIGAAGIGASFIPRGGGKGITGLPSVPEWWADPNVDWSQSQLKGQVPNLLSLSGLPSSLMETISTNPDVSRLAIETLKNQLAPSYRTGRQDLINTLEANNQLTGSTTGSSLQNYENDYQSQLTAVGAQYGLADIERALNNRIDLYKTGLSTANQVGQNALTNQGQRNTFNMGNYENQIAAALGSQPPQTGGLTGGLTGAIGGGLAGSSFGPWGTAIGAGLGGFSGAGGSPSTGGNMLATGAGLYSQNKQNNMLMQILGNRGTTSTGTSSGEFIENRLNMNPFGNYGLTGKGYGNLYGGGF